MKLIISRYFWGVVFILGGVLFLLQQFNVLKGGDLFWGLVFGMVGVLFLSAYWGNRTQWWFIVPGWLFLGLCAGFFAQAFLEEETAGMLMGMFVLAFMGIGFWVIYLTKPAHWWAIIPGGVMVSLAIVSVLDHVYPEKDTGGVFLLGLGLTFALLAILPRLHMVWAYIPALVLVIIGCISLAGEFSAANYAWPVVLIFVGIFILVREMGFMRR